MQLHILWFRAGFLRPSESDRSDGNRLVRLVVSALAFAFVAGAIQIWSAGVDVALAYLL